MTVRMRVKTYRSSRLYRRIGATWFRTGHSGGFCVSDVEMLVLILGS
jgi:hypothetical protein